MTNYEKLQSESWNSHAMTEHKTKKGIGAKTGILAEHGTGVTFADSLHSFTAQTTKVMAPTGDVENDPIMDKIESGGDTTTTEPMNARDSLLYCVNEYLKNTVGAELEEPNGIVTHKVTEEQLEWLAARHDLTELQGSSNAEAFGAFLADLVQINVISSGDAMELISPILPLDSAHPARIVYLGDREDQLPTDDGSILGLIARHIEEQKRALEYLKDEYFYTHHTEADMEYLKKLNDYLNNKQECYEVVWQVFDEMRSSEKVSMYEQRVQDATEQLKSDFSAMLA